MVDYLYSKNILKEKSKSKERERIFEGIVKKYERCNQDLSKEELDYLIMYNIPRIYGNIVNYIADYFRNVYYIAPVRATAERYYRLRNIAVNEVDCRGKNLAIFLNSLSDNQLKAFQEWTNKHLGFCVEKTLSEGHVSLKIRKKGSKEQINLSDTGFGYSQILPIVTQLWYIVVNERNYISYRNKVPVTIAIEQPELHLHPALQAKLVDVIVQVMKDTQTKKRRSVQFVLETHSETIINRFSTLIYKDKIKSDEIGISIFDRDTETMNTKIQHGIFDNEGYLENWPIGFFEPEEVF